MAAKKPVYTIDKNGIRTDYESMSAAARGLNVDLIIVQCALMSCNKVKDKKIYLKTGGDVNGIKAN